MFINLIRTYPLLDENNTKKLDKNGDPVTMSVYHVTGNDEDLERYHAIQRKKGLKETSIMDSRGRTLWFTQWSVGVRGQLRISINDKIHPDTTAIDTASSLIKQYGKLGEMMAKELLANGFVSEDEIPELESDQHVDENKSID
jgi:hypothetical protein